MAKSGIEFVTFFGEAASRRFEEKELLGQFSIPFKRIFAVLGFEMRTCPFLLKRRDADSPKFAIPDFATLSNIKLYTRFRTFTKSALIFVDKKTANGLKHLAQGDILMAVTSENVEDVCKCIAWLGDEDVVVGGHTAIIHHKQNPMYLAYWFQTGDFFVQKRKLAHGTKVIEVTPKKLEDVLLPVPPLEVQREVVEVLDKFALLTAELEKRKKQYEYYRDKLLTFKKAG